MFFFFCENVTQNPGTDGEAKHREFLKASSDTKLGGSHSSDTELREKGASKQGSQVAARITEGRIRQ